MSRTRSLAFGAILIFLSLPASCGGSVQARPDTLEVYAASSLTEAFTRLEGAFEAAHPNVDLRLTFAGSQVLRLQIEAGAKADVFASANATHAGALVQAGLAADPVPFAANHLVLVVPLEDTTGILALEDLPRAKRLVLAMPSVPAGAYADELLRRAGEAYGAEFEAGVEHSIASREPNVRLVRAKVELGAADAALVYRTDALASDRVRLVELPETLAPRVRYVAARVGEARRSAPAGQFLAFLRSAPGRAVLQAHGFEPLP